MTAEAASGGVRLVDVAIVGGGFTGAMVAIRLAAAGSGARHVAVFEPRAAVGSGIAYSTPDPDHRLNGAIDLVTMMGEGHFQSWYAAHVTDPDDRAPSGYRYCSRGTLGAYMNEVFAATYLKGGAAAPEHVRRAIVDIAAAGDGYELRDGAGDIWRARRVFLCLGHEPPTVPAPFADLPDDPAIVRDPWAEGALGRVPLAGETLVIGTGLTAYDVIATLIRRGHKGRIFAFSRNGRRPGDQGRLDRLKPGFVSPLGDFTERHKPPYTVLKLFRCLRRDLVELERRGLEWHLALDNLRFAFPGIWRQLSIDEKRRFFRHLCGLYDARRYRAAPQTQAIVERAEATGQVTFVRGRAIGISRDDDAFVARFRDLRDGVFDLRFASLVNCTGPNMRVTRSAAPLVRSLLEHGLARPDPTGVGFDVDDRSRAIAADGAALDDLRILGPLTNGHFGDMTTMPQIDDKIRDILAEDVAALEGVRTPA